MLIQTKVRVFAFDRATSAPVTGGAAAITAKWAKDYGTPTALTDLNPVEAEDGFYYFDLTAGERNVSIIGEIFPESSTSGVQVIGVPAFFVLSPPTAAQISQQIGEDIDAESFGWSDAIVRMGDVMGVALETTAQQIAAKTDQFVFTIANQVDANAVAGGGLDAAGVRAAVGLATANLDTQLADVPTVAEFEARTIVAADYFVVGDYTTPPTAAQISQQIAEDIELEAFTWPEAIVVMGGVMDVALETTSQQIAAKTGQLAFTVANQVDANALTGGGGGGGDATEAKQDEILGKFATTTLISQPVATTGQITAPVVIGDDYLSHNGRAFAWTIGAPAGAVLADSVCKFGMRNLHNADVFIVIGTITDAGGGNWLLSFDVPRTATQSLRCGKYNWTVEVTDEDGSEMAKVIPETGTYATLIEKAT